MNAEAPLRPRRPESYLERCLRVLEALADDPQLTTLAEIGTRAEMPVTTTHRVLHALVDSGAVDRHGRHYRIGARLMAVTGAADGGDATAVQRDHRLRGG